MASINKKAVIHTHESATAHHINAEQQLRRSVMACMLWEDQFYEDGQSIADRIAAACKQVKRETISQIAIEARSKFKLRHVPLMLTRELARSGGKIVGDTLFHVIQRADELTEFLSIYWKDGKRPLSSQVKQGLARAFRKFDGYQLAKYNRDGAVKLRDVLFLCHAKPKDTEQDALWKQLINGTLQTPDTWEVSLSGGKNKKETFERLMAENNLGGLAFLRNLRNMNEAKVSKETIQRYGETVNLDRVLPFRFIAAARAVPQWEDIIEPMMFRALSKAEKLPGKTAIVVDNSGSMYGTKISSKSELDRSDAACALAILIREICEDCVVIGFGERAAVAPNRRGFALADAVKKGPGGGTDTRSAVLLANQQGYDRIIVITDEQSHTSVSDPVGKGYFINVATYQNGIGYGAWNHIDGFSESVIEWIREFERKAAITKAIA